MIYKVNKMEKKFNFVYITTNLINGKQYVGDHSTQIIKDNYLGSGRPLFENAKKKYGKQNFKCQILEFFSTKLEAFNAQEKYIKEYNTLVPNGYNLSPKGGNQCSGGITEEGRKRISESKKGKKASIESRKKMSDAKKGITLSEEHKRKISESEKGRIFSDDHKRKLSESKKGEKNPFFGKPTWNKGLYGRPAWNKGIPCSEESKRKQIETKIKKKLQNG